ncbi:flagellar hook-length control protein FliK [Bradyrhizobium sp. U87765 SZCCT0131]|uniref:flagellar hook-length control protein FliK n=1 Tax=unclassified Bradyrhizobium TaxID=2631580 RepID=UPI001BAC6A98|nr:MULTISPECIES: flagellar hook-length control protein FliK [unclassified Bradyrhizobium]MBR1223132.1 flagellar hook-length control protein FliK [Bradyrhizobium sp. U87765 SZCCT0131]MBR1262840.1 flagellar hook-length control protein FliK [Bradyrhizobium sp. U87765 SZCCT0134]MBR1309319.1 flagellar hook-length control protein FliK [Bradyrhizobium sp. U87765 SZCCT0110]MBR1318649.1 flagellar hook-length control protein FliK [Bradyrhizobium sp. U87765 SZCCT0109]MBR1352505.1 flagellar hook-length co
MPISIHSVLPVIAAQEAAPDLALQPGTTIDARVLKVLDDSRVRIAIGSLHIDVLSEVPLQAGATLLLAVSETADGLRLAIVPSGDGAATAAAGAATDVSAIAAPRATTTATPLLTAIEQIAVTTAAQTAAARQAGLSPLFANAAAASPGLPEPLQQAAQQLLSVRPALGADLSGDTLKSAFQGSGLFLEAALASGAVPSAGQGMPDLKAALIVFRQTLGNWLDHVPEQGAATAGAASAALRGAGTTALPPGAAVPLAPDIDAEEAYLPRALLPVAEELAGGHLLASGAVPQSAAARAAAVTAALNLLQEVDGAVPAGVADTLRRMIGGKLAADPAQAQAVRPVSAGEPGAPPANQPPPPFRGGAPTAQPVAQPAIGADATPVEAVRRLVEDADGAIARQTLLQIASLGDRADAGRVDGQPRWQFEIPFATPQGTAVAQFEISRDGGGAKAAPATQRVWRARFSLDVEPAGPVHALVTLSGDTTSVRMWAERAETAAQLRASAGQLNEALRQAELEPGDIVIGSGAPPPSATPAPAGHFLDRAT